MTTLLDEIRRRKAELVAIEAAAAEQVGRVVDIGKIDMGGDEAAGFAEFDRRVASMRASGALKPGETASAWIMIDPPIRDPAQDDREQERLAERIAGIEAAQRAAAPSPSSSPESQEERWRRYVQDMRIRDWRGPGSIA